MDNMDSFEDLKGKVLVDIQGKVGDEEMIFTTKDGIRCRLHYRHD